MQKVALIPGGLDLNNTAQRLSDSSTGKFAIQMINMQMCIPISLKFILREPYMIN